MIALLLTAAVCTSTPSTDLLSQCRVTLHDRTEQRDQWRILAAEQYERAETLATQTGTVALYRQAALLWRERALLAEASLESASEPIVEEPWWVWPAVAVAGVLGVAIGIELSD